MTKEFHWFNLPNTIKEKLNISDVRAVEIPCIDKDTFNSKVAEIKWFRLVEAVQTLIDQVNLESEVEDSTLVNLKINWFNLLTGLEALYTSIQTTTICN